MLYNFYFNDFLWNKLVLEYWSFELFQNHFYPFLPLCDLVDCKNELYEVLPRFTI